MKQDNRRPSRRGFGKIVRMRSGRYQASYPAPDGSARRVTAPHTFDTYDDANGWLYNRRQEIERGEWQPVSAATFGEYADRFMRTRRGPRGRDLSRKTKSDYRRWLQSYILPTFGDRPLRSITRDDVEAWYGAIDPDLVTTRARVYALFRTVMSDALDHRQIPFNPAQIRGASNVKRKKRIRPATVDELRTIADHMGRYRLLVLIGGFCCLRLGELCALRRSDIDLDRRVIIVERAVGRADGEVYEKETKTDVERSVGIPRPLVAEIREHLSNDITGGRDGLIFPGAYGGFLAPSSLYGKVSRYDADGKLIKKGYGFYHARRVAGRDDLTIHGLRHTGATLAAQRGATPAELMYRLGHSTNEAAMIYQHATEERDRWLTDAMEADVEAVLGRAL